MYFADRSIAVNEPRCEIAGNFKKISTWRVVRGDRLASRAVRHPPEGSGGQPVAFHPGFLGGRKRRDHAPYDQHPEVAVVASAA